jgi:hypothetical protein
MLNIYEKNYIPWLISMEIYRLYQILPRKREKKVAKISLSHGLLHWSLRGEVLFQIHVV